MKGFVYADQEGKYLNVYNKTNELNKTATYYWSDLNKASVFRTDNFTEELMQIEFENNKTPVNEIAVAIPATSQRTVQLGWDHE